MPENTDREFIASPMFSRVSIWNIIFPVALVGVFCGASFAQTKMIIYDAALAKAYKNYDRSVSEKRQEIDFESGAKASNCLEYGREKATSTVKEDIANQLYQSEYLVCDALQILKAADQSGQYSFKRKSRMNYGKEIFNRLDLNGFPSSLAQNLSGQNKTFAQEQSRLRPKVNRLSVVSDTKTWNFAVQVVAETDANRDGKKDLIVYVVDESKEGNLRSYSTLVIYDADGKGDLKAVAPPTGK